MAELTIDADPVVKLQLASLITCITPLGFLACGQGGRSLVKFILNEATSRPVAPLQPAPSAPSLPYWWRGISSPEEVQASCETVLFALASATLKPEDPTPPRG